MGDGGGSAKQAEERPQLHDHVQEAALMISTSPPGDGPESNRNNPNKVTLALRQRHQLVAGEFGLLTDWKDIDYCR